MMVNINFGRINIDHSNSNIGHKYIYFLNKTLAHFKIELAALDLGSLWIYKILRIVFRLPFKVYLT